MFSDTSKVVTKAEIENIASELGINLPDSFIEHYAVYNGGVPSKPFFYSEDADIEKEIQLFYPLKYKFHDFVKTIEENYLSYKEMSELMVPYLPFAKDYGPNQICLNLEDKKVYVVYMDLGELDSECFECLANDFQEFLDGLSDESIDD